MAVADDRRDVSGAETALILALQPLTRELQSKINEAIRLSREGRKGEAGMRWAAASRLCSQGQAMIEAVIDVPP